MGGLPFKLRAAGKAIVLAPESRIRHHVSLSRKTNTLQDLRNSRLLFDRWRKEIKRELSDVWRGLLASGPSTYADKLSGQLAEEFLATPHAAARVIADAMLRREEAFWARKLGDGAVVTGRVQSHGLQFSSQRGGYLLERSAEFVLEGWSGVCNFYVCGRRIDEASQSVTLTIDVNGLQSQLIALKPDRHVNAGMIGPLMLPDIANRFRVTTNVPLVLTHLVVDDQVVDL